MTKFFLTRRAVQDLNEIWNYTCLNWSEAQADKYYRMLFQKFQELTTHPGLGKSYSIIASDLFGIVVQRHIIFYRKLDLNKLEITRILHVSMDVKSKMKD